MLAHSARQRALIPREQGRRRSGRRAGDSGCSDSEQPLPLLPCRVLRFSKEGNELSGRVLRGRYVTQDELASLSAFMTQRLTLEKVLSHAYLPLQTGAAVR